MIAINEVKEYCEFLAKKSQSGGAFTPKQFNLVIPNIVRDIVRKYYGVPEQYAPGMPQPLISAEITQLVRDYLSGLKPTVPLAVDSEGYAILPDDYIHKSSARYIKNLVSPIDPLIALKAAHVCEDGCGCEDNGGDAPTLQQGKDAPKYTSETQTRAIRFLSDTQFDWDAQSITRKPDLDYPIARMEAGKIQFLPCGLHQVQFTYFRYPKTPYWNSTSANGVTTYDPVGSQDIELPTICTSEVTLACLSKLGISIREQQIVNWAERTRQQGS